MCSLPFVLHVVSHVELDVQQQHQPGLTRLFAVCGHKENHLKDQVRLSLVVV